MGIAKKKGKDRTPLAWKSMELGGALISQGIEGLIGIEELTSYSLSKKKSPFSSSIEVTKVKIPSKSKNVKKSSAPVTNNNESCVVLPLPENEKSERREKSDAKRARKLLREKKRKAKKQELKLNKNNEENKEKSNPSKLLVGVESETNNKNAPDLATTSKTTIKNKARMERKKITTKKRKEKKLKLKQNKQTMSNNPEAGSSIDQNDASSISTDSAKKLKRKSSMTLANEPVNKKKKNNLSPKSMETTKNMKTKMKILKANKSSLKKSVTTTDSAKSDIPEDDSEMEENIGCIEESPLKPIKGMESWSGLNLPDSILRALSENGFKKPTEIQACSLPSAILGRRDIMGAAETGSGKTLAFGIPILYGILQQRQRDSGSNVSDASSNELMTEIEEYQAETVEVSDAQDSDGDNETEQHSNNDSDDMDDEDGGIGCVKVIDNADFSFMAGFGSTIEEKPTNSKYNQKLYALVLTPTRELAIQVRDHIAAAAKYTGIKVVAVIGGLAQQKQERLLKLKPEIVVATPGRLWELIQEGNSFLQQVDNISYLAIDETDRMIEKGHFQELQQLLLRINENEENKKRRQNFVFSATLTMVHEPPPRKRASGKKQQMRVTPGQKLQDVVKMLGIKKPKIVDVTQESGTAKTLEEAQIRCTFEEKDAYLYYFLVSNPGRTLVFCNSISCVRRLAQVLTILKCKPLPIHASMIQRQRLRNLDKFRDSPTGLLLATDVAARGLDIPDVEHVVHYQVPRTSEGYIHRSGRTARASKGGLTLLLIEPTEQQSFSRLCRTLGRANELPAFGVSQDLLSAAKERVHLARDIDRLELASKKSEAELGWYQKALADMDMVLDATELPSRISEEDSAKNRRASSAKRKQLESLLSRPLFTRR